MLLVLLEGLVHVVVGSLLEILVSVFAFVVVLAFDAVHALFPLSVV